VLHDAVLFDLDGTLVATDRFWIPAARTGARLAFEALGIEREPPSAAAWMSIVGDPFEQGLERLFPDLAPAARAAIGGACLAEERRLLAAGGAAAMPGALELLSELRAGGVRIGVASNCAQGYLDHMLGRLGLGEFVESARCLDSRGVRSKADMIGQLLREFGTRSAVFVGDRATDRDAAWENGLPHVHCDFGFAPDGERVASEARIEDLGGLPRMLAAREEWIAAALERAGCLRDLAAAHAPIAIGITGPSASGKSLFARDAAAVFRARGVPALAAALDDHARDDGDRGAPPGPDGDHLGFACDLGRLAAELFEPLAAGSLCAPGDNRGDAAAGEPVDVLVLEGPFLLDPRVRARLARVIALEVPEELALRRAAARIPPDGDARALVRLHRTELPAERAFAARYPAAGHADLVLDAANPLGLGGA
jgi:phosphoglycolate phosphatase-like HAD superfamily hydrolase/uridine kinase